MIFQHHMAIITPASAVYRHIAGIPFTATTSSSMDMAECTPFRESSMDVQSVSNHFPPWAVWTCRVYPFPPPAADAQSVPCRVYPFPPPAVWVYRVYPSPSLAMYVCIPFHIRKVFWNAGILDCPAFDHSSTGMNKNADAITSLVPEQWDLVCYGMLLYQK